MAPILKAFQKYPEAEPVLIHTGQHYDKNLSDVFFEELEIRKPDIFLGVGSGSHAEQTGKVMIAWSLYSWMQLQQVTISPTCRSG